MRYISLVLIALLTVSCSTRAVYELPPAGAKSVFCPPVVGRKAVDIQEPSVDIIQSQGATLFVVLHDGDVVYINTNPKGVFSVYDYTPAATLFRVILDSTSGENAGLTYVPL